MDAVTLILAKKYAQSLLEAVEAGYPPYIGDNGNWYVWDSTDLEYKDSGVQAEGEDGVDGQDGQDGTDGKGIVSIAKTGTSGLVDTYTITYSDSTTSTFTVTNGADGEVTAAQIVTILSAYRTSAAQDIIDATKQDIPTQVTTGTSITLADNTEYRLTDVTTLTLAYPSGNFECWLKITTASSGTIAITLPTSTYIGSTPTFGNSETWELSIKDGVVVAGKAVSGS